MTSGPLDPRVDILIAALYGELTDEERERFEKLLAEDPSLRSEWEEMQGTRRLLSAWEVEGGAPSFVLVDPRARAGRPAFGERLRALLGNRGQLGWAVAAVAVALLVLTWLDLRVDFQGEGVLLRFGPPTAERVPASPEGHGWVTDSLGTRIPLTVDMASHGGKSPYVTREEFQAYSAGVTRALTDLIHSADYNRVQSEEFNGFMRTLYQGLEDRQMESYYDLRGRIEAIRFGLDQAGASDILEDLPPGESISPGASSRPRGEGGR